MSSLQIVNPKADLLKKQAALNMNINAAKGLQEVLKSNIGPRGTLKMLVSGAGQIKITKDGNVLLHEMQIQHPTAMMIARAATAQDDMVGDGTTSNVLFIGELMKQSERYISEGVHPSIIVDGIEIAKKKALEYLETAKYTPEKFDREFLLNVARTSLRTKLGEEMALQLTEIVVDAVLTIKKESNIDLHMVEIMHMQHKMSTETRLIKGLVMDHGGRHPEMPKKLTNCFILNCNVSLEYEKTEVHSQFIYSNPEQKEKLVQSERNFTDDQVRKVIDLKRKVCEGTTKSFVVINQKGIDPISLDMLAKEGILALRRAKKRNMERLILACGGNAVHSFDDVTEKDLGFAETVHEQTLGEDKYTFVEGVVNPFSCTILIKGPNEFTIAQVKDAIRDGLRSIKNVFDDGCVVPGAGAFEISAHTYLLDYARDNIEGKSYLGIQAFAEALLAIPKCITVNAGHDAQEAVLKCIRKTRDNKLPMGIDVTNGDTLNPVLTGIFDNFCVKKAFLNICPVLVQQLLLVDEVMRAGKQMRRNDD
jgi:T-complex protein 1 subunit zeta